MDHKNFFCCLLLISSCYTIPIELQTALIKEPKNIPITIPSTVLEIESFPKYEFSYGVKDPLTGDEKEHKETRNGDVVHGSYSLLEADGSRRIVEYTADAERGFNAVVHREPMQHIQEVVHHQQEHHLIADTHRAHAIDHHDAPLILAHHAVSHSAPIALIHSAHALLTHPHPDPNQSSSAVVTHKSPPTLLTHAPIVHAPAALVAAAYVH